MQMQLRQMQINGELSPERICEAKRKYMTRQQAEEYIQQVLYKRYKSNILYTYLCPHCSGYHQTGSNRGNNRIVRREG